jgi:hypothetical protein
LVVVLEIGRRRSQPVDIAVPIADEEGVPVSMKRAV